MSRKAMSVAAALLCLPVAGVPTPAAAATAAITIADPGSVTAGTVTLRGSVGVSGNETTSVVYAIDATNSTNNVTGMDCGGTGSDDLNNDGSVGDILDCEIAAVNALNSSLAASSGAIQVGLVAFADEAKAADLDPGAAAASFVAPGATDANGSLVGQAAGSVSFNRATDRSSIGKFTVEDLGGSGAGTAFNFAIDRALATLNAAGPGPKWVMFLSDGQSPVDQTRLSALTASGVKLRSFGIGTGASCAPTKSLFKMANATGETCTQVSDPAALAAGLTGSQPDNINSVTVTIDGTSVAATVDAVGGWSASFNLGAGSYTATARAVLASGNTATAQRGFSVAAAPGGGGGGGGGTTPPPPGTVAPGPGALKGTAVKVNRPAPMRAELPARVTGLVGQPGRKIVALKGLTGSRVLLQARTSTGSAWVTVARDSVDSKGQYLLRWQRKAKYHFLRVALEQYNSFAASAAAVPRARISTCKVTKKTRSWTVTCATTAPNRSRARLFRSDTFIDGARVRNGHFTLQGTGKVPQHRIEVLGKRRLRLSL